MRPIACRGYSEVPIGGSTTGLATGGGGTGPIQLIWNENSKAFYLSDSTFSNTGSSQASATAANLLYGFSVGSFYAYDTWGLTGISGSSWAGSPGLTVFESYADVQSSGTSETTLLSKALAELLTTVGDRYEITYLLVLSPTTSGGITREIKIYGSGALGPGTALMFDTGAIGSLSASTAVKIHLIAIRDTTTTLRCTVTALLDGLSPMVRYISLTPLSSSNGNNTFKITGISGSGGATGDITLKAAVGMYYPAGTN